MAKYYTKVRRYSFVISMSFEAENEEEAFDRACNTEMDMDDFISNFDCYTEEWLEDEDGEPIGEL